MFFFSESEGECVNDYVTEIIPDYNVIESGNCGMKFECADGTCIDAEGKIFLPIFLLKYTFRTRSNLRRGVVPSFCQLFCF